MKLRPLHDRIIVKRLEEERKSTGGIVIPDTAAEKPSMGEVVSAGPGKTDDNGKLIPIGVKAGSASYSESTRARNSSSTERTCSTCAKTTSSASLTDSC